MKFMTKKLWMLPLFILFFAACDNAGGAQNNGGDNTNTENNGNTEEPGEVKIDAKNYKLPEVKKCAKPETVRELSSGMQKVFYQVNSDNAASLSLFGGASGIRIGKKETVVIVDFMQYKDMNCEEKARYGVGVRLFLTIKKSYKGLDVNNLPQVAASAQLGKATVQYKLMTIGITGPKINDLIPRSATNVFDVEGYANVVSAVDKIQNLIKDNIDGVVIDPQLIPLVE